jgi:hypothetical protein
MSALLLKPIIGQPWIVIGDQLNHYSMNSRPPHRGPIALFEHGRRVGVLQVKTLPSTSVVIKTVTGFKAFTPVAP